MGLANARRSSALLPSGGLCFLTYTLFYLFNRLTPMVLYEVLRTSEPLRGVGLTAYRFTHRCPCRVPLFLFTHRVTPFGRLVPRLPTGGAPTRGVIQPYGLDHRTKQASFSFSFVVCRSSCVVFPRTCPPYTPPKGGLNGKDSQT